MLTCDFPTDHGPCTYPGSWQARCYVHDKRERLDLRPGGATAKDAGAPWAEIDQDKGLRDAVQLMRADG